jgi:hypothetical protein
MNEKFVNRVALKISSQLKEIYKDGYSIGDEVYIPINSVAYDKARIMTGVKNIHFGYKCGGDYDAFKTWERWVSLNHIRPKKLYDILRNYHIKDDMVNKDIIEKTLEYFYD